MPGESYSQKFKELNIEERMILQSLKKHIGFLAGTLGERNMFVSKSLKSAAAYIDKNFRAQGHEVSSHEYILQKGLSRHTIVMDFLDLLIFEIYNFLKNLLMEKLKVRKLMTKFFS